MAYVMIARTEDETAVGGEFMQCFENARVLWDRIGWSRQEEEDAAVEAAVNVV